MNIIRLFDVINVDHVKDIPLTTTELWECQ